MLSNLVWNYTADEILSKANKLIENTNATYDDIAAVPLADVSYNNILRQIANTDCNFAVSR